MKKIEMKCWWNNLSFLFPALTFTKCNTFSNNSLNILNSFSKLSTVNICCIKILLKKVWVNNMNNWAIHHWWNSTIKIWFHSLHIMIRISIYFFSKTYILKYFRSKKYKALILKVVSSISKSFVIVLHLFDWFDDISVDKVCQ
jgi:hypothetical protein